MVIYSLNSNDVTKVTLSAFLKQMHAWIHVRVYALNISLVFVFTYINCSNFFGVNVICVLCDFNYANNFLILIYCSISLVKNSHKNKVELCLASESLFHI